MCRCLNVVQLIVLKILPKILSKILPTFMPFMLPIILRYKQATVGLYCIFHNLKIFLQIIPIFDYILIFNTCLTKHNGEYKSTVMLYRIALK